MAASKVKIKLQGHEKFSLREGWLEKGLMLLDYNPDVFQGKEGPDVFGIGSNMVKSLRYWLRAFGLIEEKAGQGARLTDLGRIIYQNDCYLENTFTLWVLHSYIAKNLSEATTWYMFFNRCSFDELTKEQLHSVLSREISKHINGEDFSDNSLKSDIDVLLNMYSREKGISDPEEKNISPFSRLGLVKQIDGKVVNCHPDQRIMNEWVVLYELADLMNSSDQMAIESLISGERSIGMVYQLSTVSINAYLDRLDTMGYIRVDRTAGLDMVYRNKEFTPLDIVSTYYEQLV